MFDDSREDRTARAPRTPGFWGSESMIPDLPGGPGVLAVSVLRRNVTNGESPSRGAPPHADYFFNSSARSTESSTSLGKLFLVTSRGAAIFRVASIPILATRPSGEEQEGSRVVPCSSGKMTTSQIGRAS